MSIGSLLIGCIADDFSGASDAASHLKNAGLRTFLLDGCDALDDITTDSSVQAVVIALKSRAIPPQEAVKLSCEAVEGLLKHGARQIYFKYCSTFDSTARGNIGPVTDALLELLEERFTLLCPPLPANGRTVQNGTLYVNGVPLAQSPMRNHPINPMTKSSVPEMMMMQSRYPCYALPCGDLRLPDSTSPHFTVVPHYVTSADGHNIVAQYGHLRFLTGGSDLLYHLGRRWVALGCVDNRPFCFSEKNEDNRRLILAGSCSEMTQKQVAAYIAKGKQFVHIDPQHLCTGEETTADLCQTISQAQGDILFYSTADKLSVEMWQRKFGSEKLSRIIEELLGELAVQGLACGFRRIIVAGGETSGAVAQALGFHCFYVGDDVAVGVPELIPVKYENLHVVLKSGNFGQEDFFLTALLPIEADIKAET